MASRYFLTLCVLGSLAVIVAAQPTNIQIVEAEDDIDRGAKINFLVKVLGEIAKHVKPECVLEAAEKCVRWSSFAHPIDTYNCGRQYLKDNHERCASDAATAKAKNVEVVEAEEEMDRGAKINLLVKLLGEVAKHISPECILEAAEKCVRWSSFAHPVDTYHCGVKYFKDNHERCTNELQQN